MKIGFILTTVIFSFTVKYVSRMFKIPQSIVGSAIDASVDLTITAGG